MRQVILRNNDMHSCDFFHLSKEESHRMKDLIQLKDGNLEFSLDNQRLHFGTKYRETNGWAKLDLKAGQETGQFCAEKKGVSVQLTFSDRKDGKIDYEVNLKAEHPTRLRLELIWPDAQEPFHLIPACLFGDNNHSMVRSNEFPTLHDGEENNIAAAPLWEFRADRASHPVAMICCDQGVAALSINPYSDCSEVPEGFVRNGLFAALPATFGVSLGYGNDPLTYVNKTLFTPATEQRLCMASAKGRLYLLEGSERSLAHEVIRDLYTESRKKPIHEKTPREALEALANAFIEVNWSEEFQNYTNMHCRVPTDRKLQAWRPVSEIGWSGGGVLAYPFAVANAVLEGLPWPKPAEKILDEIAATWSETSGFLSDVAGASLVGVPGQGGRIVEGGQLNGWWSGFMPHTMDRHCAYTNGNAAYYLLKTARFLKRRDGQSRTVWEKAACAVCDTVIELQREDGAFGYLFSAEKREVVDWDGFAGCWFAAAMPLAYQASGDERYLESGGKAMKFYGKAVRELNCYGTPMDTWKSIDQEGVLAFIQAAQLLHEVTGEEGFLKDLRAGADYEFLWRYAYKARPEFSPLKDSKWNSCGGSVTSVSNPHIHPMGLVITSALRYLAEKTGDGYYQDRADDGVAWALNTLELYPEVTGYGRYGLLSERFCPSDGLVIETYEDSGEAASTWWSYNAWGAANIMEALSELVLAEKTES